MTLTEAISVLAIHNAWRRGSDEVEMVDPTILGQAIDIIVQNHLDQTTKFPPFHLN